MTAIRVMLVDDHALVRLGFKLFGGSSGFFGSLHVIYDLFFVFSHAGSNGKPERTAFAIN